MQSDLSSGRVASTGMFIIDRFEDGAEQIGGGGVFAMVSARMFLPADRVGLIVDVGNDFPDDFLTRLKSYGEDMLWLRPRSGPTTRALNQYSGGSRGHGHQSFEYLTPRIQLWPEDVLEHWKTVDVLHIVCGTTRLAEMMKQFDWFEEKSSGNVQRPKLVWEPLPLSCVPAERKAFAELGRHMAVISPNLLEAQTLLDLPAVHSKEAAEEAAEALVSLCRASVVIRAGDLGSYADGWVPAYWSAAQQHRVIDPTGGGNAFLGGLCAGLKLTDDLWSSAIYGSAAASFAIQQHGLPILKDGRWNGEDPFERVREIQRATSRYTRKPNN